MPDIVTSHVDEACPDGDHDLEFQGTVPVCRHCGLSGQTLTDYLGHEQWFVAAPAANE